MELRQKTFLITGGASGLGEDACRPCWWPRRRRRCAAKELAAPSVRFAGPMPLLL